MNWLLLIILISIIGFSLRKWLDMVRLQIEERAQTRIAEERRRFISRLDHELKNPLTAIRVNLANLAEIQDAGEREHIQENIEEQILRLTSLVSSLRKLTYLETGTLERTPIQIRDLIQHVIITIQDRPETNKRQINYPRDLDDLPTISGDMDLLQLAIYNLLDNAVKFTTEGDNITLSAYVEDAMLIIEVEDSGMGIYPEDLPFIWEDLYRSQEAHGIPGNGIGLAIVKAIVERHDGEVGVESEVGEYTRFRIALPVY